MLSQLVNGAESGVHGKDDAVSSDYLRSSPFRDLRPEEWVRCSVEKPHRNIVALSPLRNGGRGYRNPYDTNRGVLTPGIRTVMRARLPRYVSSEPADLGESIYTLLRNSSVGDRCHSARVGSFSRELLPAIA